MGQMIATTIEIIDGVKESSPVNIQKSYCPSIYLDIANCPHHTNGPSSLSASIIN